MEWRYVTKVIEWEFFSNIFLTQHNVDCGQKKYGASSQQKVNGNTVITITCRETTQEESYDYNYNYDSGYEYQYNSGK